MAGARRLILEVVYGTHIPTVTALSFLYSLGEREGMHPNAGCTSTLHFFFSSGLLSALGCVSSFVLSLQVTFMTQDEEVMRTMRGLLTEGISHANLAIEGPHGLWHTPTLTY